MLRRDASAAELALFKSRAAGRLPLRLGPGEFPQIGQG
jgi:hypothetical protein